MATKQTVTIWLVPAMPSQARDFMWGLWGTKWLWCSFTSGYIDFPLSTTPTAQAPSSFHHVLRMSWPELTAVEGSAVLCSISDCPSKYPLILLLIISFGGRVTVLGRSVNSLLTAPTGRNLILFASPTIRPSNYFQSSTDSSYERTTGLRLSNLTMFTHSVCARSGFVFRTCAFTCLL